MLTVKEVENAKAKASEGGDALRTELADGAGLFLVVQPSGTKSWAFRYRHFGKPRKLTLGPFPLIPLADKKDEKGRVIVKGARTLAGQAREAAENGKDPAADKRAEILDGPDRDLVPTAMRSFIERYAKPKNRDWTGAANLLGLTLDDDKKELVTIAGGPASKWATRRVQEIRKRDILDILQADIDRGAPFAANRRLAHLRRFFNWLMEWDRIDHSPCAGIKAPTQENARDRILTDDEIRWFWKACELEAYPFGHMGKLLLMTGQRRSEVSDMVASEVQNTLWTIPGERTKNGDVHTVHLTEAALSVIESRTKVANDRGYLFCTNGMTSISGFSKAKKDIDAAFLSIMRKDTNDAAAELDPWRFHDLRRTVASGMARIGISLPVIEKVLNHKSGSFGGIVGVYQRHGFDEEKKQALEAWGRELDRIVTGKTANVVKLRA